MKRLDEVLKFTVYSGPEKEYAVEKSLLFTFTDLKGMIQSSDTELMEGLDKLEAIEIDGFYRILLFEYEFRVLSQMLDLIEENSWPLDQISKRETLESLNNFVPAIILNRLFDYYTLETKIFNDEQLHQYNEAKICKIFARYILKDAEKFNFLEFVDVWKCSVPEGMTVDVSELIILFNCSSQFI